MLKFFKIKEVDIKKKTALILFSNNNKYPLTSIEVFIGAGNCDLCDKNSFCNLLCKDLKKIIPENKLRVSLDYFEDYYAVIPIKRY